MKTHKTQNNSNNKDLHPGPISSIELMITGIAGLDVTHPGVMMCKEASIDLLKIIQSYLAATITTLSVTDVIDIDKAYGDAVGELFARLGDEKEENDKDKLNSYCPRCDLSREHRIEKSEGSKLDRVILNIRCMECGLLRILKQADNPRTMLDRSRPSIRDAFSTIKSTVLDDLRRKVRDGKVGENVVGIVEKSLCSI